MVPASQGAISFRNGLLRTRGIWELLDEGGEENYHKEVLNNERTEGTHLRQL